MWGGGGGVGLQCKEMQLTVHSYIYIGYMRAITCLPAFGKKTLK